MWKYGGTMTPRSMSLAGMWLVAPEVAIDSVKARRDIESAPAALREIADEVKRGNTILSAMGISRDEFFSHIGRSINSLVLRHRCDLDRKRLIIAVQRLLKEQGFYLGEVTSELDAATSAAIRQYGIADGLLYSELVDSLRTAASDSEHKTRWVDQTPEYSFHICGLRKLFPCALFIHIVRDVGSVVRSMLNFHRIAGTTVVANEEEAYRYWLRTVRACLKAEEAYGPHVVYRLRYAALVENPESTLRLLLDFLGEPYSAK